MPLIDFSKYEKTDAVVTGEGAKKLPAGGYIAKITDVRTEWTGWGGNIFYSKDKEYVKLIFDITEGEYAGIFKDMEFDENNDWRHWACLSWKGINTDATRMGMFKGVMTAFEKSNPGFDAVAAFQADKWDLFVGKSVGLIIGEEEYESRDGEIKVRSKLPNFRSTETIRAGEFKVPPLKKLSESDATSNLQPVRPVVTNSDDVPF